MSAVFNASFNLSYEVVLAGLVCTVITSVTSANKSLELCSDVCLEAEASPRGSLEAENLLPRPRLDVLLPCLAS